jgi:hypothetical protein
VILAEGMLFLELAKVKDGWLWYSGMIGNKSERGIDYFGKVVVETTKGTMENTDCEAVANVLCGSLL